LFCFRARELDSDFNFLNYLIPLEERTIMGGKEVSKVQYLNKVKFLLTLTKKDPKLKKILISAT
jgi:hypothetical protein